jgi:hypothetical protein
MSRWNTRALGCMGLDILPLVMMCTAQVASEGSAVCTRSPRELLPFPA